METIAPHNGPDIDTPQAPQMPEFGPAIDELQDAFGEFGGQFAEPTQADIRTEVNNATGAIQEQADEAAENGEELTAATVVVVAQETRHSSGEVESEVSSDVDVETVPIDPEEADVDKEQDVFANLVEPIEDEMSQRAAIAEAEAIVAEAVALHELEVDLEELAEVTEAVAEEITAEEEALIGDEETEPTSEQLENDIKLHIARKAAEAVADGEDGEEDDEPAPTPEGRSSDTDESDVGKEEIGEVAIAAMIEIQAAWDDNSEEDPWDQANAVLVASEGTIAELVESNEDDEIVTQVVNFSVAAFAAIARAAQVDESEPVVVEDRIEHEFDAAQA